MKVKSLKNLATEVQCIANLETVKGGSWGNGSLLGGGGSRPMRPTMSSVFTFDITWP